MRPGISIILSPADRRRLEALVGDRNVAQKHVWRARIVLHSADGIGTNGIMRRTGKSKTCVWRWQERFAQEGYDGLLRDKTRPSRIPPLGPEVAERVVALTLSDPPAEATHWVAAMMAKATSISVSSVQRIWRAHGLRPHRVRQFKLSNDPDFVAKLRDVVGLYVDPPAHAIVLSVDEKSQIQALDRTQPGLPMKKGRLGTMTHDYKRHGTTTLFAALNVLEGKVIGRCMQRHRWRLLSPSQGFVPLSFDPGEAYQFDWSHEYARLSGVTTKVKAAHMRLCYSRMQLVQIFPRESQEMVFEAHERAFHFFGGVCRRGIYDNMKTAVSMVFVGKERAYNRRFLELCSHHLVEPVACTPGAGWEKGQVERQVGDVRGRLFVPIPRGRSHVEINEWLMDRCIEDAKKRPHPTIESKTVWQVFEEERPFLMAYRGPFDGFHATEVAVSKTCLVRFDNNHYSVAARAVGRPVDVRAYADRVVIRQDGETVAEHPRSFGRGEIAYDPWHYVPILTRKPGALRNGAPFKGWQLPGALGRIRARLTGCDDGDRQFVRILAAVQEDGLEAVEAACAEALDCGACSADVVLNILARQCQPAPPATIPTPEGLQLRHRPVADCQRYDRLREAGHGAS